MNVIAKPRRAKQMPPKERKKQLLEIAIEVFADKGLDRAKHVDVAKAAGVSVPTTFTYFPTREDLVTEVLKAVKKYLIEDLTEPYLYLKTFEERMIKSGEGLLVAANSNPAPFKIWSMWSSHFGEPYRSSYMDFEEEYIPKLVTILCGEESPANDEEIKDKAFVLMGLACFLTQLVLRGESEKRQEAFMNNVINTIKIWV